MATLKELKGRIGSVASSEKITGAMKMISSAKMHKAEGALRRLVPFRSQIETIIGNVLSSDADFASPLVTPRDNVRQVLLVTWGSDDGLCGAYNVNIYKQIVEYVGVLRSNLGPDVNIHVMAVGKKLAKAVAKIRMDGVTYMPVPEYVNSKIDGKPVIEFSDMLRDTFLAGTYDRVDVLYMNFISSGRQRIKTQQLLPVLPGNFSSDGNVRGGKPYLFEPSPNAIFNAVLPMFLMASIQDIFSQNQASEQAARVMAMQSANDNAKTLLEQLQLEYNKLRQQSITTELLDIVGGQVRE